MKRCIFFALILITGTMLIACSKTNNVEKKDEGGTITPAPIVMDNMTQKGEVIKDYNPTVENTDNVGFEYILKDIKLYDNPEAAGIERGKMAQGSCNCQIPEIMESPNIDELSSQEVDKNKLLVAKINIKNINANKDDMNISAINLAYINTDSKVVEWNWYPAYFSATIAETPKDTDYFHYELAKGKSTDVDIAWLVNPENFDMKNLYLVIDYMSESQQTVLLDIQ